MLSTLNTLVLLLLFCILLYYATILIGKHSFFAIESIRIEGEGTGLKNVNPYEIQARVQETVRGNFFTVNVEEILTSVKAIPWVRSAKVRRVWPRRLKIYIEEFQPIGRFGKDAWMSTKGDVFETGSTPPNLRSPILQFDGPKAESQLILRRFHTMNALLSALNVSVVAITVSERLSWHVRLSNGMEVGLGQDQGRSSLDERIHRFVGVFSRVQENTVGTIQSVDLRYPNGFAIGVTP